MIKKKKIQLWPEKVQRLVDDMCELYTFKCSSCWMWQEWVRCMGPGDDWIRGQLRSVVMRVWTLLGAVGQERGMRCELLRERPVLVMGT